MPILPNLDKLTNKFWKSIENYPEMKIDLKIRSGESIFLKNTYFPNQTSTANKSRKLNLPKILKIKKCSLLKNTVIKASRSPCAAGSKDFAFLTEKPA